ncbi:eCIS core domain-containing protein [Phormidesmis sp. 146-33]
MRQHQQNQKPAQTKTTSVPVSNPLQTRPFAPQNQASPNLQAQPLTRQSKGDNLLDRPLFPSRTPIQAKLTIGQLNDKYEQEADQVARQAVQRIHAPVTSPATSGSQPGTVQRLTDSIVQRRFSIRNEMDASPDLEALIQGARGSGQPLSASVREPMQRAFGADFSRVRVHANDQSDQLNRSIQAKAFTTGQDVFFREGAYQPGNRGGQELIAHELTHVVQQTGGVVRRVPSALKWHQQQRLIQRQLGDKLATINGHYLDKQNFIDCFPGLKNFKTRQETLTRLKKDTQEINSDEDILQALRRYSAEAEGTGGEFTTNKSVGTGVVLESKLKDKQGKGTPIASLSSPQNFPYKQPPKSSLSPLLGNENLAVLSTQPVMKNAAKPISLPKQPKGAMENVKVNSSLTQQVVEDESKQTSLPKALVTAPGKELQKDDPATERAMKLYEDGRLLVTSIQPKDLPKMHSHESLAEVATHVKDKKLQNIPEQPKGAMENAKVNWSLTSPRMLPHYFKMVEDKEDRTPKKTEDLLGNRIATLVDATHLEIMYMRGKESKEDLSEWMTDQSSGKHAGVQDNAPLYSFSDKTVKDRLDKIKKHLEERNHLGKLEEKNPEINTFGFPPAAVVGFLVVRYNQQEIKFISQAKKAMSLTDQKRSFPVFTWKATEDKEKAWKLVYLAMV